MSVELHHEAPGNILTLNLSGKLTREDYAHFTPQVDEAIQKHGKIRLLVRMHDFHGWTLGAAWEDLKFDLKHFSDIDRLALVGDKRWEVGMAMFCKPFTRAKVKYFDESEAGEAVTWIHDGMAAKATS